VPLGSGRPGFALPLAMLLLAFLAFALVAGVARLTTGEPHSEGLNSGPVAQRGEDDRLLRFAFRGPGAPTVAGRRLPALGSSRDEDKVWRLQRRISGRTTIYCGLDTQLSMTPKSPEGTVDNHPLWPPAQPNSTEAAPWDC
jgi:hypothetical protein